MDMKSVNFTEMSFKIGEVAAMFDISTKTLRIYDRIGLLKPSSIDGESGYRYYSPNQISRLEVILNLKRVGFSLSEISLFVNGDISNNEIATIFRKKHTQLQSMVDSLEYNMELIEDMISSLKQGTLIQDKLTEQERAILLSRVTCLENAKLEESLTQILWL
ncbi:MerR family transcriptional regulator [Lachnoclostridium phytofermentans]|uniref:Transcriptional regulator, MerR family n=1 Tax=Lachnoclostridium phytofermentans (strain ATCC 700394 / DSM 18823 / ISDg) TaxID=357809 RepID=A9KPT3_LACP7|nr:helix-turn-helix domain-containing protein [Lachnoclostridium phytofermentans]ABX41832.1 transcriptional regulator, MerR family [Lachnoclostridium phytofermentans ISDg]